jgi:hypothetical protein
MVPLCRRKINLHAKLLSSRTGIYSRGRYAVELGFEWRLRPRRRQLGHAGASHAHFEFTLLHLGLPTSGEELRWTAMAFEAQRRVVVIVTEDSSKGLDLQTMRRSQE